MRLDLVIPSTQTVSSKDDSKDEDYDGGNDSYSVDNISLDGIDYDEEWDWTSVLPKETLNPRLWLRCTM